jgi:hypothetical protein
VLTMRWNNLFDDLEAQLEAEIDCAEQSVHDDEERQRQAQLTLHERLRNVSQNSPEAIGLTLAAGHDVTLTLTVTILRLGRDWCAVDVISPPALQGHALVQIAAVVALNPTELQVAASLGQTLAGQLTPVSDVTQTPRLVDTVGLGFVLRDLARRRRTLEIHSLYGVFVGTLDRVGADHCDLAEHREYASRRQSSVLRYRVLSLASISLVRIL